MSTSIEAVVDAVEDVLTATLSLVRDLDPAVAGLPTDCPGWTVHDQLAHMVGLEQVLTGAPEPDIELPPLPHITNDVGVYMERHVHIRRALPFVAVADELAGLLPRRVAMLRLLVGGDDVVVTTPLGNHPVSVALSIRTLDLWTHEQDIRRAVGLPPRIEGPSAAIVLARTLASWTRGLPRTVDGLDGELVVEVTGPDPTTTSIVFGSGGGTALLRGDLGEVTRAFCGRGPLPPDLLTGDPAVVAAVAPRLAMTP